MTEDNMVDSVPRRVRKTDLKSQVEEELVRFIKHMDLAVNRKLPREEELARMLGVSRITLRSVLDDLSAKGMIFRKHGKGTFVNSSFFEMKASFNPVMHFADMIRNSGYEPRVEMIDHQIVKAAGIGPKAFLLLKGVNFDEEGTPAVYTWEYVDTEILKYSQIRKRILHYEDV